MADEPKEENGREAPEPQGAAGGGVVLDNLEMGAVILRRYVLERMNLEHPEHHISLEDLEGSPHELEDHNVKEVVEQLIRITAELRHNAELQRLINQVDGNFTHDIFMMVANSIFDEGITWARIVCLFHLVYELIYRAITTDHNELVRTIISWANEVIRDLLHPWILKQGGWAVGRHSFPWRTVVIGASIALVASLVYFRTTR